MTISRTPPLALRSRLAGRRALADGESGLTLVEMVVALFLVTMVLTSFVGVSIAGATSTRAAEARARANQVGNQEVETFKSIPWASLGLYDNDRTAAGASPSAACGSEPVVSLGSSAPTPRVAPAFSRAATIDGRSYTITNCITWRDDPADGTVAAGNELDSDQGHDVKHLVTTVTWVLLSKTRTITFDSLRSPTAAEVPPVTHSSATLTLTAAAPSPATQQLAADNTLTSPLTLSVTASLTATSVTVTYAGKTSSVTTALSSGDGGTTWTLVIPAGASGGTFNAGRLALTFQGTSGSGSAQTTASATLTAPPTPFTVSVTATPASVTLTSGGRLSSAITLNVTTSVAATAVSVSYPTKNGTGSMSQSGNGTAWTFVLAADSSNGPYDPTPNELFTVTATNGSGSVSGTATVALTAPAPATVVIVSTAVSTYSNGKICVKNGQNTMFGVQNLTVTVDNVATTDSVNVTWGSGSTAGSANAAAGTVSGGHTVFQVPIPAGSTFSGSTATFTILVTRASDSAKVTTTASPAVQSAAKQSSCGP